MAQGLCLRHGAQPPTCNVTGCTKLRKRKGLCKQHNKETYRYWKPCSHEGCTRQRHQGGVCLIHGAIPKLPCKHPGCTNSLSGKKQGLCWRHGPIGPTQRSIRKYEMRRRHSSWLDFRGFEEEEPYHHINVEPSSRRNAPSGGSKISPTSSLSSTHKKSTIVIGDIGYVFRKEFVQGWFTGTVVKIMKDGDRRCEYSDGDVEDLLLDELVQLAKLDPNNSTMESHPSTGGSKLSPTSSSSLIRKKNTNVIGDIGYVFRKEFVNGWFAGTVVKIFKDGDRRCKYSDGDVEDLSLADLKRLARLDPNEQRSYNETPRSRLGTTDNNLSNKLEPQDGISAHIGVDDDSSNYFNSGGLFDSDSSDDESEDGPSLRIGKKHVSVEAGAKDVLAFNLESEVEFDDDDNSVGEEMNSNTNNVQSNDEDKGMPGFGDPINLSVINTGKGLAGIDEVVLSRPRPWPYSYCPN